MYGITLEAFVGSIMPNQSCQPGKSEAGFWVIFIGAGQFKFSTTI